MMVIHASRLTSAYTLLLVSLLPLFTEELQACRLVVVNMVQRHLVVVNIVRASEFWYRSLVLVVVNIVPLLSGEKEED